MIIKFIIFVLSLVASCVDASAADCQYSYGRAYQSSDVQNQTGVNVHVGFFDTPYGKFNELVVPALNELGIWHIRDFAVTDIEKNRTYVDRLAALSKLGYRFSLVAFDEALPALQVDPNKIDRLNKELRNSIDIIEGPNEPNLAHFSTWVSVTRASQQALYVAIKADPSLVDVKVAGPSPWGPGAFDIGDLSSVTDLGNWHTYSGGLNPEAPGQYSIAKYIENARRLYGNRPILSTEDGYHSALQVPPRKHNPTPEEVIERYLPRLILVHLNCGIFRTYIYELIDRRQRGQSDPESNFGLVRATGERKAAFFAIKNLLQIFADPGPAFKPEHVAYTIDPLNSRIWSMQFRKRNGDVLIAVWIGASAWNPEARQKVDVAPIATTINIPSLGNRALAEYSFKEGGGVVRRAINPSADGKYPLTLSDRLVVLEAKND